MKIKTIFVSIICYLLFGYIIFSYAEEPGTSSIQPVISVQSVASVVQEVVGLRDANTRVWENVREVPVTDDETGKTELVSVRSQVYEKADNLCYNRSTTKTPDWVPTVEEITPVSESGFAYAANQGGYQVSFTGDLTSPWSIVYQVQKQVLHLGVRYLGYYDASNGSSVFIASVSNVTPKLISPNRLYYSNAFPGVDIEYVYTKGRFLQNAIINSLFSYPSPTKYGMNPQTTQLIIATELDLADNPGLALSVNNQKYTGVKLDAEGKEPIVISNATTGKQLCSFEPNVAFDNSTIEQRQEIIVTQQLLSLNDKHYLVEGVPLTWITSATLPVTIDYELKSGGLNGNEVWLSGKTYYLSGLVTVTDGNILVIQGGAIIKCSPSTSGNGRITVASGGKIIAQGSKFNYIVFTSANDTSVGESTPNSYPPYYEYAIRLELGSSAWSKIRYCKIKWTTSPLIISTDLNTDNQIQNNILRGDGSGNAIKITNTGSAVIKNNLIVSWDLGVYVEGTAQSQLNTIDSTRIGILSSAGNVSVTDTLISNAYQYSLASSNGTFNHDYNAFYNAPLGSGISTASHETTLQANPYIVSPNGSYYLNQARYDYEPFNPICPCIDGGSMQSTTAGMNGKTTVSPLTVTANITNVENTWSKVDRDTGLVDIGYHYEPVDIVVQPAQSNLVRVDTTAHLTIDPGVVVSFYRTGASHESKLRVCDGGKLTAVGSSSDFIQFTSVYATSDEIQAPLRGRLDVYDYSAGVILHTGANHESDIQYSDIKYANTGIRALESLNLNRPIQNNYFAQNNYAIAFDSSANNVVNNLFEKNRYGVAFRLIELQSQTPAPTVISYLQSNTFYNNDTGIYLTNSLSTATGSNLIVRLENNILSSNYAGVISTTLSSSTIKVETRNNYFWNNQTNAAGSSISLNTSTTENRDIINEYSPMLVHKARLSADQRVETSYLHDGFYLAQRAGDASRFPLRQHDLTAISISGISQTPVRNAIIRVYAADNYSAKTSIGEYNSSSGYTDGNDCWGNILIEFVDDADYWTLTDGDYIELTFATGDKIKVYLPGLDRIMGSLYLWVAQDGSTYYGTSNYLAQHDALTWFPLREHDLDDIGYGISREINDGDAIRVYACTSYGQAVELGYYIGEYEYGSYPHYVDGADSWGNIKIKFDGQFYLASGDYLDLSFASETTVRIELPGINDFVEGLQLYIAEDYSCHSTANWDWSLDQDAYFALQYAMPSISGDTGLAMSAYDGASTRFQSQDSAHSPAVDKGAVKVTPASIAGTTNDVKYTLFASLGYTNTNESTPDSNTTSRYIPAEIPANHTDPIGRLDLGYHYKSGVVYSQDIFDRFTTYWEDSTRTFVYGNIPNVGANHDVGAGDWKSDQLTQDAIAVFRTAYPSDLGPIEALGYHILNTPIVRIVHTDSIHKPGYVEPVPEVGIQGLSVTVAPNGTIFTAIGFNYRKLEPPDPPGPRNYVNVVQVYRFNKINCTWDKIAEYYYDVENSWNIIYDLAAAASNDTVWVCWTQSLGFEYWIRGKAVPATGNTTIDSPDNILSLNVGASNDCLDLTYDALQDKARIVFLDDRYPYQNGTQEVHTSPLSIVGGQLDLDNDEGVAYLPTSYPESEWSPVIPRITYNPHYFSSPYSGSNSAYVAFQRYYWYQTGQIHASDLINPSSESWQLDPIFDNIPQNATYPDITYRAGGTKLVVGGFYSQWYYDNIVWSNCGTLVKENGYIYRPRTTTNAQNQRDMVLVWHNNWGYLVEDNPDVLCMQEIYP